MQGFFQQVQHLRDSAGKMLFVLIDPDKWNPAHLGTVFSPEYLAYFDAVLVGGSALETGNVASCVRAIQRRTDKPIVLFPGDPSQICTEADAILLLTMISGRNPDLLIGHHVKAARNLRESKLEIVPTGYILVGNHQMSSVSRVSRTEPIPYSNLPLIESTALCGEQLGLKLIYLEQGSGAADAPDPDMVGAVRKLLQIPLAVGGGVQNMNDVRRLWEAGADIVVVGTAIERNPDAFFRS